MGQGNLERTDTEEVLEDSKSSGHYRISFVAPRIAAQFMADCQQAGRLRKIGPVIMCLRRGYQILTLRLKPAARGATRRFEEAFIFSEEHSGFRGFYSLQVRIFDRAREKGYQTKSRRD